MGASNAALVVMTWPDLSGRAWRVLMAMALLTRDDKSLDGRPARRYRGGPNYLAEVLYGTDALERTADGLVYKSSALRQVEKVLTELVRQGALRRVTVGGKNHRAEYELQFPRREASARHRAESVAAAFLDDLLSPTERDGLSITISPTETVVQTMTEERVSPTERVGLTASDAEVSPTETVGVSPTISGRQPDRFGSTARPFWSGLTEEQEEQEEKTTADLQGPRDHARDVGSANPEDSPEPTTEDRPAPPADDPWGMGTSKRLTVVPEPDDELDYETAYRELTADLGLEPATTAAIAYAEANGCSVSAAVVRLARDRRGAA